MGGGVRPVSVGFENNVCMAEEKEKAESFAREAVMKRMADAAEGQFP